MSIPDATARAGKARNSSELDRLWLAEDELSIFEEHQRTLKEQEERAQAAASGALSALLREGIPQPPWSATAISSEIQRVIDKHELYSNFIREIWETLRDEMYDGKLPGYAFLLREGKVDPLPPHVWRSVYLKDACFKLVAPFLVNGVNFTAVGCVRETELTAMLEGRPIVASSLEGAKDRDPGGRPEKYNTEGFLIEAFRIIYEGGQPETQADLRRQAIKAYDANRGIRGKKHPSDEWAKPKIRRVWYGLGLGKKG
jgi:hypothetical protein